MNIDAQFQFALDVIRPGREWENNVHDAVSVSAYNFSTTLLLPNAQNSIYTPWWTLFDAIQHSLMYDVMSNNYRHELIERGYLLVGKEDAFKTGRNFAAYGDHSRFNITISLSGGEGWRDSIHDHVEIITMYEIKSKLFNYLPSRNGIDGLSVTRQTIRSAIIGKNRS